MYEGEWKALSRFTHLPYIYPTPIPCTWTTVLCGSPTSLLPPYHVPGPLYSVVPTTLYAQIKKQSGSALMENQYHKYTNRVVTLVPLDHKIQGGKTF